MHIAISAHFWGQTTAGSGQYIHRLVDRLLIQEPAIQLTLIADSEAASRAGPPSGVGWVVARTPFDGRQPHLAKLWYEQIAVPRLARAAGADLLHVPYFAPPLRSPLPVIVTIHDLIPMILPAYRGNLLVRAYTALAARGATRARMILADSDASRRDILHLLPVEARRVRTVYLGIDETFRPQPAGPIEQIRRKFDLPERFALYLGGFDARKNVPRLLEALARSKGEWPLVLAGKLPAQDTSFFPDPRRLARTLGVESRLRFTGWIEEEEKPALLSAATLFLFPSAYEGFGLPILEAMACGTATITSDRSSLPELAGDGAALISPDDPNALRALMEQLMEDGGRRDALAARGQKRAACFSWERCAAETVESYRRAVKQPALHLEHQP